MRSSGYVRLLAAALYTAPLALSATTLANAHLQVQISGSGSRQHETLSLKIGGQWQPAMSADSPLLVRTASGQQACSLSQATSIPDGLLLAGNCEVGTYEQRVTLTAEEDVLDVQTRLTIKAKITLWSVEDRYDFLPPKNPGDNADSGPLDFVWSQNLKSEPDDLIPSNSFKSPVVIMQQGAVLAALMPNLSSRHVEVRALDLDVTSGPHPWMAFGAIPSEPHGHSFFRRASAATVPPIGNTVNYHYAIVLSAQPAKLGYRRIVRRLWQQMGHPALLHSESEQQNALRPELNSFATWRHEAWENYADRIFKSFSCGSRQCGTLSSNRSFNGDWSHGEADGWFNAWFETLRTAYGWYLHGRATNDAQMMAKAESILTLSLSSPQKEGAFSSIYLVGQHKWLPGDGWAGYADSFHAFSMSWTAYWMLRWAEDLTPQRKAEVLRFVRPYGDFLLAHQQKTGVIPSWYRADSLQPRSELRDFNAETAPSALFLVTLGISSGDIRYTKAAERAMQFIDRQVVPRQRWFDFETFLSCSPKPYDFYDRWTAQYPRNNLAEIQAPQALLSLFHATGNGAYLEHGSRELDYLLLTQQVWNNPQFTPQLLGGFTTQNSDAEWSDARQGYAATVLIDYYFATGNTEYLERGIAAARSTFAVAPWENWAHAGYLDEPGALTGFHWGTGSAMTSVEIIQPKLGDAFIDLVAGKGVGFDECTIRDLEIQSESISFYIASPSKNRHFLVRFRGAQPSREYVVRWNGGQLHKISGDLLSNTGVNVVLAE